MRVAMLHWAFPPIVGGVETHLCLLGAALAGEGHRVGLLTGAVDGREGVEDAYGMQVWRSPLMDLNSLSPALLRARAAAIADVLEGFLRDFQPDLIHAHNMHYFSPVHAGVLGRLAREAGVPLILTAHNVWDDALWEEMRQYRRQWERVIAVSEYIARAMARDGYPARRIRTIHHGIDPVAFHPPAPAEVEEARRLFPELAGRRVIFHPARMGLAKGSHITLLALQRIRKAVPEVVLVMAGTANTVDWGNYRDGEVAQMRQLVEDLGLQENVFVRFFPWNQMPLLYRLAEVVVYPSVFEEPFGLVMLEAMATGKPLVVTRSGGMPEVVRDGENGYVVNRNDWAALAERCIRLLEDRETAAALGSCGRAGVEKFWNTDRMMRQTVAVYREAVEGRKGEAGWKHRIAN